MPGDGINWEIVEQLMELDEDDGMYEFTNRILQDYFTQMEEKMPEIHNLVVNRRYEDAAHLGHFLKGSSAAIGAECISDICDKIQHYKEQSEEPQIFLLREISQLKLLYPAIKRKLISKVQAH